MFTFMVTTLLSSWALALNLTPHISASLLLEQQSFELSSVNFPLIQQGNYATEIQLVNDSFYLAQTDVSGSTYNPTSKRASIAARPLLGAGFSIRPLSEASLRMDLFSTFGHRTWVNAQYYMYNPSLDSAASLSTPQGTSLAGIIPNSTELIHLTEGPHYGLRVAALYHRSDRYSFGPTYSYTQSTVTSNEYLMNNANASFIPSYYGTFHLQTHALGALWVYRVNEQASMHWGIEAKQSSPIAQKAIYFNDDYTQRYMPNSAPESVSNWTDIDCTTSSCTCQGGSDCNQSYSTPVTSYDDTPYLNLNRFLARTYIGVDFSIGDLKHSSIY